MSVVHAAGLYDDVLVSVKVIAYDDDTFSRVGSWVRFLLSPATHYISGSAGRHNGCVMSRLVGSHPSATWPES